METMLQHITNTDTFQNGNNVTTHHNCPIIALPVRSAAKSAELDKETHPNHNNHFYCKKLVLQNKLKAETKITKV